MSLMEEPQKESFELGINGARAAEAGQGCRPRLQGTGWLRGSCAIGPRWQYWALYPVWPMLPLPATVLKFSTSRGSTFFSTSHKKPCIPTPLWF